MKKFTKVLAYLAVAAMMATAFTACGGNGDTSSVEDTTEVATEAATEAATEEETTEAADEETTEDEDGAEVKSEDVEFEEAKDAADGQAYLAIVDGQWWIQYWGSSTKDGYMLSYDAGIADITGDGTYTVSVTADTNGFRYDTTGDVNDQYTPEGLSFMSVMIPDGENLYPGAVITVDSIKVDGNEIEMTAKNYTSSDDGKETRTNLYNSYVTEPSQDARTSEGALYEGEGESATALDICADYSAQVVDPADFAQWTTVEVTFTITGTGAEGGAAGADSDAEDAASDAEGETTEAADAAE